MSLQHILKNSSISGKEPLASQLANGELSINYHADGPFLCCKDTAGNVRRVAGVWVATTAPSTPFPGELWLDTSITPSQLRVYKDTTDHWVYAGEVNPASTTYAGIVQLATNGETQIGTNVTSAVTPASLQSKISDSTTTVSSTTIASSTAVKSVADTVSLALPKSGGTITGVLEIGNTGQFRFEGSSNDGFETTLAVEDPTGTRTITLPNRTGTVITTGDTGTVTSTMIADGTIVNADINASASIAHSKLAALNSAQVLLGNAGNVPTATTVTGDVTISNAGVTSIASGVVVDADINASAAIAGTKVSPDFGSQNLATTGDITIGDKIIHAGDTNTAIRFPAADIISFESNGSEKLRIDANGRLLVGASSTRTGIVRKVNIESTTDAGISVVGNSTNVGTAPILFFSRSRGTSIGDNTIVQENDALGYLAFNGADGTSVNSYGAWIKAEVDGTPGANDMPGRLILSTTSSGSATPIERLRIDSSGTTTLTSATSTAPFIAKVGTNEVARIDGSGRLLVGTSSARTLFGNTTATSALQVEGTDGNTGRLSVVNNFSTVTNGAAGQVVLARSGATSLGSYALVANNNWLGLVSFQGGDGTAFVEAAEIKCEVDGTPGADDMPGRLVFSTTADGSATPTERMRIDSSGNVGIATSSPNRALEVNAQNASNTTSVPALRLKTGNIAGAAGYGTGIDFTVQASNNVEFVSARIESTYTDITNQFGDVRISTMNAGSFSEKLRIDSSGRLLVGTSSAPSSGQGQFSEVVIDGSSTKQGMLSLQRGQASNVIGNNEGLGQIVFSGNDGHAFAYVTAQVDGTTGSGDYPGRLVFSTTADGSALPTERMRIDSSGRVGVGTSSPRSNLSLGASASTSTTTPTRLDLGGSFSTTAGTNPKLLVYWDSADYYGFGVSPSQLDYMVSSLTPGAAHVFYTNGTERMRIESNGNIRMNDPAQALHWGPATNNRWSISPNSNDLYIANSNFSKYALLQSQNFTGWTFGSDRRIKENIVDLDYGIDQLKQIKARRFNFIGDTTSSIGFIAQELQEVIPEAVTGTEIPFAEEDTQQDKASKTMGITRDTLLPVIVKALQEAVIKIETLEAKVAALEAA